MAGRCVLPGEQGIGEVFSLPFPGLSLSTELFSMRASSGSRVGMGVRRSVHGSEDGVVVLGGVDLLELFHLVVLVDPVRINESHPKR